MEVKKVIHIVTRSRKEGAAITRRFPEVTWFCPAGGIAAGPNPVITFVFPLEFEQRIQEFLEEVAMYKDKQVIRTEDVGSLEELLGPNDSLFQPEPKQEEWVCPRCAHRNSYTNEVCMGAEMGDGRCGHPRPNSSEEEAC